MNPRYPAAISRVRSPRVASVPGVIGIGMIVICLCALLPSATPLEAQTILNTERFQQSEVDGFHMSANFSIDGKQGNSRVLNVASSGIVGVLSDRHWVRLIFGGKYLSDRERAILDNQFGQIRYSYIFSDRLQSFHFVQGQRNETLRLRNRWLIGSGLRRTVLEAEHTSVSLGTGLMQEWERLDESAVAEGESTRASTLRMANQAVVSHDLDSRIRILNVLYFQPALSEIPDFRILNDLGLLIPITDHLRLTFSAEWRRDTRPPSDLGKDDLTFSASIGLEFD